MGEKKTVKFVGYVRQDQCTVYTVYYNAKACDFISKQLTNKIALKQLHSCLRQWNHIRIDNKLSTIKQTEYSSIQAANEPSELRILYT